MYTRSISICQMLPGFACPLWSIPPCGELSEASRTWCFAAKLAMPRGSGNFSLGEINRGPRTWECGALDNEAVHKYTCSKLGVIYYFGVETRQIGRAHV